MRGMEEIVAFLEEVAPDQRVFYEGKFDGAFSFYTRADDQNLTRSVTLDSKLLYATAMDPSIGMVEMVASPQDVVEAFRVRCGCRWLVVEGERGGKEVSGVRYLREALRGPDFELVRSFPFEGPPPAPSRVDVYRFKLPIEMQERQQLQFPIIGVDGKLVDDVTTHSAYRKDEAAGSDCWVAGERLRTEPPSPSSRAP